MRRFAVAIAVLVAINAALLVLGASNARDLGAAGRTQVGLVFDVGGLGDKSFNDAAYRGLSAAMEEFDLAVRYVEPGDGSDRESAIREMAAAGYDLVIGVGFIFTSDMQKAAANFPDVRFACIDYSVIPGQPPPPSNLAALRFREHEGSFLVGAAAALVSKTKTVGFVGGMEIPLIRKFEAGFRAGVKHVCADCKVLAAYAGTEPKAFADPARGKELALSQYGSGADVIYHAAGKTGAGVFAAARAQKRFAIGVDSDQFHEAPCCVLTSMVKGVDTAVAKVIAQVVKGGFEGGVFELGLAEKGVDYVFDDNNRQWLGGEVRSRLEALRRELIAGEIYVPEK